MIESKDSQRQKLLSATDTTRVKVRFNDTDSMGVVHFKNYMVYFDDGFVSFAKFGDYIIVKTRIKNIGNKSIKFIHELYKESDNTLLAKIEAVRFVLNLKTNELMDIMDFLEYYLQ